MSSTPITATRPWLGGRALLNRLLDAGTDGYPAATRRRLSVVNFMAYLIFFASLNYAIIYAASDFEKYRAFVLINLVLCALALAVPLFHRFGDNAGGLFIAVFEFCGLFSLAALLGHKSGIQINYIIAAAVPFLAFDRSKPALIFSVIGAGLVLHLAAWFLFPPEAAVIQADPLLIANIYVFSAVTAFGLIAAIVHYALTLKDRAEARTEELIRNMLPESIAERLKADPTANIAEHYPAATVMFADAVGFTALSHEMGAERTVTLLNEVFTAFDDLAEQFGLEKIKTVGDAYMAVCGAPEPSPDHMLRVASMALSLRSAVGEIATRQGVPLELRIGIATGPVVGGVIGRRKLVFDVWGDTVNLAARLQSNGMPGKIQISAETALALSGHFTVERRDVLDIKGFGEVETFFLAGRQP